MGIEKTINGVSALVCQGELPRERTDGHCPARAPEKLVQGGILEPVSNGLGQQSRARAREPGATSAVVSMRLPRRGLVLGLDCRPQLARWSQLPTTGERIQENCTELSAKVRVALEVPHEDHTKSVSEWDLSR